MLTDRTLDENLDRVDYYALLGVARDATAERIREAFHKFALRFHPDQHVEDPKQQARAGRIFKRGSEGYRVLLNPGLRARYDEALGRGQVRLTPEAERQEPVAETRSTEAAALEPLPADLAPLFTQAEAALAKGDIKNAKAFLQIVSRRSTHPKVKLLLKEILEAEKALLSRRGPGQKG
ncbi:MAG: DnaJ domain-containing protein [Myxococcales bacterium]|nr:DnaJ domain-containing protein [Myxococcales bacterium]